MTTDEFNNLLRVTRNGGRAVIGGDASRLQDLLRKMVAGFLRKKCHRAEPSQVDDLVAMLFVRLLKMKTIPEGYTWNSWFWYSMKSTWADYCRQQYACEQPLDDEALAVLERKNYALPIPVEVNARLLENNLADFLRTKVMQEAPPAGAPRSVWTWAVTLLITHGMIQNEKNAAIRSGLSEEVCRKLILQAVVKTRLVFEGLYGRGDRYAVQECAEANSLAEKVF
jgi:hypothetical protein